MSQINEAKELVEKMIADGRGNTPTFNPFGGAAVVPADEHQLEASSKEDVIAAWESIGAVILKSSWQRVPESGLAGFTGLSLQVDWAPRA
jgi:hypothetical protein